MADALEIKCPQLKVQTRVPTLVEFIVGCSELLIEISGQQAFASPPLHHIRLEMERLPLATKPSSFQEHSLKQLGYVTESYQWQKEKPSSSQDSTPAFGIRPQNSTSSSGSNSGLLRNNCSSAAKKLRGRLRKLPKYSPGEASSPYAGPCSPETLTGECSTGQDRCEPSDFQFPETLPPMWNPFARIRALRRKERLRIANERTQKEEWRIQQWIWARKNSARTIPTALDSEVSCYEVADTSIVELMDTSPRAELSGTPPSSIDSSIDIVDEQPQTRPPHHTLEAGRQASTTCHATSPMVANPTTPVSCSAPGSLGQGSTKIFQGTDIAPSKTAEGFGEGTSNEARRDSIKSINSRSQDKGKYDPLQPPSDYGSGSKRNNEVQSSLSRAQSWLANDDRKPISLAREPTSLAEERILPKRGREKRKRPDGGPEPADVAETGPASRFRRIVEHPLPPWLPPLFRSAKTDEPKRPSPYENGLAHDYLGPEPARGPYTDSGDTDVLYERSYPKQAIPHHPCGPDDIMTPVEIDSREIRRVSAETQPLPA